MDDIDIIFATKELETVSKDDLIALFGYLNTQELCFDIEKKVWHDKTREHVDIFHYIGLLCEDLGGLVVHIPVKAWHSFKEDIPRSEFHLNDVLPIYKEFSGKLFKREGGIGGKISYKPKIVWERLTPAGTPPDQPKA